MKAVLEGMKATKHVLEDATKALRRETEKTSLGKQIGDTRRIECLLRT